MKSHHRTLVVLCLVAGGLAAVGTTASATDPALTCDGHAATIVQTGGTVHGTDGDDVIVATDAAVVDAMAGDDVVCAKDVAETDLGAGDDTYIGRGSRPDQVDAGDSEEAGTPGHDVVTSTTPATDVTSGSFGDTPDTDDVTAAHLELKVAGVPGGAYRSTDGAGAVALYGPFRGVSPREQTTIDVPRGSVESGSSRATIAGLATFDVSHLRFARDVTFRGSSADETLIDDLHARHTLQGAGPVSISMGGGNDDVDLRIDVLATKAPGVLRGGSGDDALRLSSSVDTVTLVADLADHRLQWLHHPPLALGGFERLHTFGYGHVSVTGTSADERFTIAACSGHIDARGGNDVVRTTALGRCRRHRPTFRVSLGRGNDTAYGSARADVILGGPGRDVAHGGRGRDRCVAERTTSCERR